MSDCSFCGDVYEAFIEARKTPLKSWRAVYSLLKRSIDEDRLEVYASDCEFDRALDEISKELHYCYRFYLKCRECGEVFYMGICVRGTPAFKTSEEISENDIERLIRGNIGTYFNNK